MDEKERMGLASLAIRKLNEANSWTGRIHIQKLIYLAQELLGLGAHYEFVLYQRGPYSFELDDDVRSLRSVGAAEIILRPAPYGPTYVTTAVGNRLVNYAPVNEAMADRLGLLANVLGPRDGSELELLATTLYVMREGVTPNQRIVDRVRVLKPRFDALQVEKALSEVRALRDRFATPT